MAQCAGTVYTWLVENADVIGKNVAIASAVCLAGIFWVERRVRYTVTNDTWYDPDSPDAPAKYRNFLSDEHTQEGHSVYDCHTPETFKSVEFEDLTADDIKAARMGSVTNAELWRTYEKLEADLDKLPGIAHWMKVMSATNDALIANTWAIMAEAKARSKAGYPAAGSSSNTKWCKEQFKEPPRRGVVQSAIQNAWTLVRKTLVRASFLAEAGYSILDLDNLPSTHQLHHTIGRFGCVIASPTHPNSVAIGYKLLPPRQQRGGGVDTKKTIDMAVCIVFQGSQSLIGLPSVARVADWACTNFWPFLTTTPPTSEEDPLPAGLRVHGGFYGRFRRMWPAILQNIKDTRAAVERKHNGIQVNVQVTVAGHSQAGALATLTAMAIDGYVRRHNWHPCCGTDLFVFSAPAMFAQSTDGTYPTLDDTTVRCVRFSVDNDTLAQLPAKYLGFRHPSAGELQLSGLRCNVGTHDAHTDYSRLIRTLVGPLGGIPQLHLLAASRDGARHKEAEQKQPYL